MAFIDLLRVNWYASQSGGLSGWATMLTAEIATLLADQTERAGTNADRAIPDGTIRLCRVVTFAASLLPR
jgi:hypothetical protein